MLEKMLLKTAGLQTTIWNNNIKSLILLTMYPVILGAVIFAAASAFGFYSGKALDFQDGYGVEPTLNSAIHYAAFVTFNYWPILLSVVIVWFMIAYFFQGSMIRAMSHSHPVTRREEPALYNLVENMCISQGVKLPRIEIIESHARNAFASGVNEGTYCITVTRGLMQSLSRDELEAVLAHELTHILNRDVRLMMVCVVFTGMLGVATQIIWSNMRYGLWLSNSNKRNSSGGIFLLFVLLGILWVGYMATLLARFAISRSREYMADAGAVQITKNPEAMMRALARISGMATIPKTPGDIRSMCFENALPFLGLFATHPPIEARIKAIAAYSSLPLPDLKRKERAADGEVFARPSDAALRSNWTTRERFKARRSSNPWI
jgi:heat shock protein HtpX